MLRYGDNYVAEKTLARESPVGGTEHQVDCLMLDMRSHTFEQKIKFLKANVNQEGKLNFDYYDAKKRSFTWGAYDMCCLVSDILGKSEGQIEE